MAARRKFGATVSPRKRGEYSPVAPETAEPSNARRSTEVVQRHRGRKAGKRSDPAYRPTTIFVRKETQRKATRLLEDQDIGKDFSDLVEELVAHWIATNSAGSKG